MHPIMPCSSIQTPYRSIIFFTKRLPSFATATTTYTPRDSPAVLTYCDMRDSAAMRPSTEYRRSEAISPYTIRALSLIHI